MNKILVYGATSAIAQHTLRHYAEAACFYLVARNEEALCAVAEDLRARGAKAVYTHVADLNDASLHEEILTAALNKLNGCDLVLVAYGMLGEQRACQEDFQNAYEVLNTNFLSVVSILTGVANYLESVRGGTIVAISSVAGDRGRRSNYCYGAAKGGLSLFLQGLRSRLTPSGVRVVTVKPGFVDTPMTASVPKNGLFRHPSVIGHGIVRAVSGRADIVYLPGFWRLIMAVIVSLPERLFKRLSL